MKRISRVVEGKSMKCPHYVFFLDLCFNTELCDSDEEEELLPWAKRIEWHAFQITVDSRNSPHDISGI